MHQIKSVAFEGPKTPDRGYTMRVSYLEQLGDALVELMKDGSVVREFLRTDCCRWTHEYVAMEGV